MSRCAAQGVLCPVLGTPRKRLNLVAGSRGRQQNPHEPSLIHQGTYTHITVFSFFWRKGGWTVLKPESQRQGSTLRVLEVLPCDILGFSAWGRQLQSKPIQHTATLATTVGGVLFTMRLKFNRWLKPGEDCRLREEAERAESGKSLRISRSSKLAPIKCSTFVYRARLQWCAPTYPRASHWLRAG